MKLIVFLFSIFLSIACQAQRERDTLAVDTTFTDYDALFSELDILIDSLSEPRSFTLVNLNIGNGFFSYPSESGYTIEAKRRFTYSPSIGYYSKSGLGLSAGSSLVNDGSRMNPFQFTLTGSYDYLNSKSFLTGVSFSRYFTKKELPFYTSPLQNEVYGYFTYRKSWLKPSVSLSYGWGSREAVEEREEQIQNIQLAQRGFTRINTRESIIDFNIINSVRHDFYFLKVLSGNDFVRITPQVSFVSGTQQFGFNQTSNTYGTMRRTGRRVLYSSENISLDNQLYFQPISLTGFIKTEYSVGKFFLQPQAMFDYYFPVKENHFTTSFFINAGFAF